VTVAPGPLTCTKLTLTGVRFELEADICRRIDARRTLG